jgi:plasmid replication initiation protein
MDSKMSNKVAKIDNSFVVNAQYKMTAKEQKVLYYLIAHLDPLTEKEFYSISVPLEEVEEMLKETDNRSGSVHEDMNNLCKSLSSKQITFPSRFTARGRAIHSYINWFQSIIVSKDETGQIYIKFTFSADMSPFLLELHHYVNIKPLEVVPMTNAHAIRMYSIFKSEKDRLKNIKDVVTMTYVFDELKAVLGIGDKYKSDDLKGFRNFVLNKIKDDINTNSPSMSVDYNYLKKQRKVTGVAFNISDKEHEQKQLQGPKPKKEPRPKADIKTYMPSDKELEILSKAKLQAYHILLQFGIFEGIAYKQILPKIKGSEFDGYEDFFVERAIQHFEKNAIQNTTKELKASTFVTWWTKNKVFESGDVWADILEKLSNHKKQLMYKNPEAYENRAIARTMTNGQFVAYINNRKG